MRFILDEDVNPAVAEVARGMGLQVTSVHEINRRGFTDLEQLQFAATKGRTMVTRNRDDFIKLTVDFYQAGLPHFGVLIVPYSLPNNHPERIANALRMWCDQHLWHSEIDPYTIDFLSSNSGCHPPRQLVQ
jgi:predicted nuclease of predicted toxin-antitoxin system